MNFRLVFKLTGKTLLVEAGALLLPLLVCLFYRENPLPFLLSIAMTGAVGLALSLIPSNDHFFPREGFFAVALIWLLMSAFGALPFFFSGFFPSYVDCFFESVSGFTTTGASILTAVEPLPRGILFWRSFMHWMGGMGVLILTIALLPSLGGRTLHVMRAESPGPIVSKLVPKTSQSSKILYGIYCALTLLEVFCLRIAGMPWYDSLVHSFATAGTGGFSTRNLSIAAYESPAIEVIITLFMLVFSINFALYFLLLCGKVHQALRSDELRFFLAVVAFSTLLISINIWPMYPADGSAVRHAAFQVGSIISTTGFASTDFNLWPEFSRILLVLLMFIGACPGSTGGGIKTTTFTVLAATIVCTIRGKSEAVILRHRFSTPTVYKAFTLTFVSILLVFIDAGVISSLNPDILYIDCLYEATSAFGTVGLSASVTPNLDPISKLILIFTMFVGRVGPLSFGLSILMRHKEKGASIYPEGRMIIG